jgi:hypothetical protein
MLQAAAFLILSLGDAGLGCADTLRAEPGPVVAAALAALERGEALSPEAGLEVRLLDESSLLVRISEPDLEPLGLNGAEQSYNWSITDQGAAIVLAGCRLPDVALGLVSGPHFIEWTGPDFHQVRPVELVAEAPLRTVMFSSAALGEDREVYFSVPAGWDGTAGDPLVLSGDGLAGSDFARIAQTLADQGRIRPVAFASAGFGEAWLSEAGLDQRSAEYLVPGETAALARRSAYDAHEAFFFEEFLTFAVEELGGEAGPVILFGISASASFALEQGVRRPGQIAAVIAASPPITAETRRLVGDRSHGVDLHLWCGGFETLFCDPLTELGEAAGLNVQTRRASHTTALWEEAFAASLIELAPPGP